LDRASVYETEGHRFESCQARSLNPDRIVPPESKYGGREVPLPAPLAAKLRTHLAARPDQDSTVLAFPSEAGGPLDPGNLAAAS
jgi:hypothetical protein